MHNIGQPPGTIVSPPSSRTSQLTVITYDRDNVIEQEITTVDELASLRIAGGVLWLNVDGLGDTGTLSRLAQSFNIHPLALEDVFNLRHRPKAEEYDDHVFVVSRMLSVTPDLESEQISLFLLPNETVLTLQERPGDCLEPIRERIRRHRGQIRGRGGDYLLYAILDAIVDGYFPVLEHYGDRLENIEESIETHSTPDILSEVQGSKRDLRRIRRAIWPQRELVNVLRTGESTLITESTQLYLRDCYDHILRLSDLVESYQEWSNDLSDFYLSTMSNRMNEVMRILTIIATIFIPLTFVAGIYGMNFDPDRSPWNMPELRWAWGYPAALGVMAVIAVAMVWFFRRRGWVGRGPS